MDKYRPQRYGKRHEKALGKARKVTAEGINMKLVSEYIPILICFVRFLSQYPDGSWNAENPDIYDQTKGAR